MSLERYDNTSVDAVLARIESKLDVLIDGNKDHENRIRRIEAWMLKIIGASGAVSAVVAIVIKFFENK